MASTSEIDALKSCLQRLREVDDIKLRRSSLGDGSLKADLDPLLTEINQSADLVERHARSTHDGYVKAARQDLEAIRSTLLAQSTRNNADYIAMKDDFLSQLRGQVESCKVWQPMFVAVGLMNNPLINNPKLLEDTVQKTVGGIQQYSDKAVNTVRSEMKQILTEAAKLAKKIEAGARQTAENISVKEAQLQFADATKELTGRLRWWGGLMVLLLGAMICLPIAFMYYPPHTTDLPGLVYHSVLRLLLLTALGACTAFALRIFRAYLHMREKNKHRVRVANSVQSFLNATNEPQQRDLMLAKLAEGIVDFGDSGIIQGDKDESHSVLSNDLIARIFAAVGRRS